MTYEAIVVDGEDVLLLGDHESEASASTILEGNAGGLGAQDPVDVIAIVELVVKASRDLDGLGWITILNDDKVIRLEERPPLLKEVEVTDGRDHDVELVLKRDFCHLCGSGVPGLGMVDLKKMRRLRIWSLPQF